jgi:hypothetical protein
MKYTATLAAQRHIHNHTRKGGRTSPEDGGGHGDRLHVGDRGGAAEQTDVGREGRLEPGLALAALEALDQRGLLAADVGACGEEMNEDGGERRAGVTHSREHTAQKPMAANFAQYNSQDALNLRNQRNTTEEHSPAPRCR